MEGKKVGAGPVYKGGGPEEDVDLKGRGAEGWEAAVWLTVTAPSLPPSSALRDPFPFFLLPFPTSHSSC
jgi:hypothetical protein